MISGASRRRLHVVFGIVCVATLVLEGYAVVGDRDSVFNIEGEELYDVTQFGVGQSVSHAFLMRGDGLNAVSVRVNSSTVASVRIQWTLWRGYADEADHMSPAFEGVASFDLRPGRQWETITFTRDGSSKDRWYTIQLRLLDPQPPPSPQVSIVASRDNPDRGGVLFVNDLRQPGSLNLRAERRGRTLYRRFLAEAAPNLPAMLQVPAVQWAIALVFHWALIVFAYTVLSAGRDGAVREPS